MKRSNFGSLQKEAGVLGMAMGGAARVATKPFRMFGNMVHRGLTGDVGNTMGFVGSAAMGIPTIASMSNPLTDPNTVARGYQARQLAANTLERPMKVGLASSVLSAEDLEASLLVYRQFEKQAATVRFNRKALQKVVGNTASEARAARMHPKQFDELKLKIRDLERKLGLGESGEEAAGARAANQDVRQTTEHSWKADSRDDDARYQKARADKAEAEANAQGARWTPGGIARAGGILGAVGTALGVGTSVGSHAVGKGMEAARAQGGEGRYNAVTKIDPSLKENPLARKYFDILDRASPYIAGEPYLAAAAVQQMINTPGIQDGGIPAVGPRQMSELFQAERGRQDTRFPWMPKQKTDLREITGIPV